MASGDYVFVYPAYEIVSANYYKNANDIYYFPLTDKFTYQKDTDYKNLWVVLAHLGSTGTL